MSPRGCIVEECLRPHNAKGLCGMHGTRLRRHGSVNPETLSPRNLPLLERLMAYTDKTATCWLWMGGTCRKGYARASIDGKASSVHRAVFELMVGPIPDGLEIDHLCMVRNCVNPDHLEPVDHKTNVMRSPNTAPNVAAAQTVCKFGHPFDATYESKDRGTRRYCKTCVSIRSAKRRAA